MKKRRLLSLLLSLAMMLTMMPSLGMVAYATENNPTITLAGDITYDGSSHQLITSVSWTKGDYDPDLYLRVNSGEWERYVSDNETLSRSALMGTDAGTYTVYYYNDKMPPSYTEEGTQVGTVTITAASVDITGVTLDPSTASVEAGKTVALTATVLPDNATDKTVTWTSSDETVATVSNGTVTGVKAGTATITATATNGTKDTSDDKTATCEVTVTAATTYPLYVGGTQVTSANASNITGADTAVASYDADSNTLTLNGYTYKGSINGIEYKGSDALTISFKGTNAISSTGENSAIVSETGTLIFSGEGTLTTKGYYGIKNNGRDGAITIQSGTVDAEGKYGISVEDANISVGENVTSLVATGSTQAFKGKVKNAIAGSGWTDTAGTTGKADIAVSTTGQSLSSYKKVQFPVSAESFVITSSNFSDYFDSDGVLKDTVAEGSVLDFQGEFSGEQYKLTINKKVTVTSTSDPVAKFDSSSTENVSNVMTFTVAAGADYTTISNLEFLNCRLIIQGATHVTVDNINISVKDKKVGSGTGFITICGGASDAAASYAVIKNSTIECSNNNGYSCVVMGKGADHITFEDNTAKTSGNVGNIFIASTYYADLSGSTNPEYITYKNNNIENDSTRGAIYAIALVGKENVVEGNKIKSKSIAIATVFAVSSSNNTYKNNTITNGGSMTIAESSKAEGNVTDGTLTVSGTNAQITENTLNSNVNINYSATTFQKNNVKGTVTVSSSSKGNTIKENTVVSTGDYAVVLKSAATDSNTSVEDNTLVSKDKLGDDAVNPGTGSGNTIQNNNSNGYTALQDAWIQSIADMTYTGEALEPTVVVKNGSTTLTQGTDYQVAYKDNTNAGTATVTVTRVDGSTYGGKAEKTFTIAKAAAPDAGTITDAQKPTAKTGDDVVYTGSSIALVSAPSELPTGYTSVVYSLDGENWSDQIPTGTNAGNYTVNVKYTSDNYNDLVGTDVPVTIAKANAVSATITASNRTFDGTEKSLVTVDDSTLVGGEMQYALGTETEATGTYGTSIPTATNAGTYYVWYKVTGDKNHNDKAAACVTVTIAKAASSATVTGKTLTYTGSAQELVSVSDLVGGTVLYSLTSADADDFTSTIPTKTAAGSYTVYWKVTGDANHNDSNGSATASIGTKAMSVSATGYEGTYDGEKHGITVTVTEPEGAAITYSESESGTYSATVPTYTNVGEYTVYYKVTADNYTAVNGSAAVKISKAAPTVTAPTAKTLTYTGEPQAPVEAGSATGGKIQYALVEDKETAPTSGWVEAVPTTTNAGTYYVWYRVKGDANHSDTAAASVSVTIAPAVVTVKANPASRVYGYDNPAFTYTASGFIGKDSADSLLSGTLKSTADKSSDVGEYDITQGTLCLTGTGAGNYTIEYTGAKFTVSKASQTAPSSGEGYSVSGTTLTVVTTESSRGTHYEIYDGSTTYKEGSVEIGPDKSYYVRWGESKNYKASSYTAIPLEVSVTVTAAPASMGSVKVTGVTGGKANIGAEITAEATPNEGYEFVSWQNTDGTTAGTETVYTFTAKTSTILMATFKPKDKKVADAPQTKDFTYDGTEKTGVVAGKGFTVSGDTKATNAGAYKVTAALAEDYDMWPDGTSENKTLTWNIYKKTQSAPTVTVSEETVNVTIPDGAPSGASARYSSSLTADKSSWTEIAGDSFTGDPGTYYIYVPGDKNTEDSPVAVVYIARPTMSAVTMQPSDLDTNKVTFNGVITPKSGLDYVSSAAFEYKAAGDNSWTNVASEKPATGSTSFSSNVTGLSEDTDYTVRAVVAVKSANNEETKTTEIYGDEVTFHTLKEETEAKGSISVSVTPDNTDDTRSVTVTIEEGNNVIASKTMGSFSEGKALSSSFDKLPDGYYNIVVRTADGDYTETRMVEIVGGKAVATMFTVPAGRLATVVDVKTEDTPKAAVEGLDSILTEEDKDNAASGSQDVEVKLEVEKKDEDKAEGSDEINKIIDTDKGDSVDSFLDLSLIKTVTDLDNEGNAVAIDSSDIGNSNKKVIEIAIPYTKAKAGLLKLFRYHASSAAVLTELSARPTGAYVDGTYYIDKEAGYIFLYASSFSTYAIVETKPETPAAPTLVSKTDTTIVVEAVAGQVYSIDGGTTWIKSGSFTGLSPATEYSIVTKVAATNISKESDVSEALKVTTDNTPSPAPTPDPKPAEEDVDVPISGDESGQAVEVSASIKTDESGTTSVTISEITAEAISEVAEEGGAVTIDLTAITTKSGAETNVTSITVSTKTVENVIKSKASSLEIKLDSAAAAIDSATLEAIAEAAKDSGGDTVTLVIDKDDKAIASLNNKQKAVINEMDNAVVLDAYFVSGGKRISDFKGGTVQLTASYESEKPVTVLFIGEDGSAEKIASTYDAEKKLTTFKVNHFSNYVITETKANTLTVKAKKTVKLRYLKLRKKAQKVKISKLIKVRKAIGTVTYSKVSAKKGGKSCSRYFTVNAKTGKITVKKGLKKGTYTIAIKVKAAGENEYAAAEKIVKVKIRIR